MQGVSELDSTVLSTLPISMQYDALIKVWLLITWPVIPYARVPQFVFHHIPSFSRFGVISLASCALMATNMSATNVARDLSGSARQMRERMQNENRQGFTDRQGRPLEFSSFQMTHFLKSAKHKCGAVTCLLGRLASQSVRIWTIV